MTDILPRPHLAVFSQDEKRKALMKEIAFRREVFARRVLRKQMTPHEAKYQIAIFEAILEDYKS